jgi:hypothetical protein
LGDAQLVAAVRMTGELTMEGIHFVTDEDGRKVAVQIDLERYGEIWEDFYDALLLEERKDEPRESFIAVEERLVKDGKLEIE